MNIPSFLKSLKILHGGLVLSIVVVFAIAIAQGKGFSSEVNTPSPFIMAVPVLTLLGYFLGKVVFNRMVSKILISDTLSQKLSSFQKASLVKYALVEIPLFFALYAYYLSGNALPLVIAACLLFYLIALKPTGQQLINLLPLGADERRMLETS